MEPSIKKQIKEKKRNILLVYLVLFLLLTGACSFYSIIFSMKNETASAKAFFNFIQISIGFLFLFVFVFGISETLREYKEIKQLKRH